MSQVSFFGQYFFVAIFWSIAGHVHPVSKRILGFFKKPALYTFYKCLTQKCRDLKLGRWKTEKKYKKNVQYAMEIRGSHCIIEFLDKTALINLIPVKT